MFNTRKETSKPEPQQPAYNQFEQSKPTNYSAPSHSNGSSNILGEGTEIEGNIKSTGSMQIHGSVKGTIVSEGKLTVSNSGNIEGDIFCKDVELAGKVTGNVKARGKVTVKPKALIKGDVRYYDLEIEPGAHIACTISRMNPDGATKDNSNSVEKISISKPKEKKDDVTDLTKKESPKSNNGVKAS